MRRFRVPPDARRVEGARRLILKLLLPDVNLVGMDLVALSKVHDRGLLPQRLQRDLRLQPGINPPSRLLRHRSLRLSNEAAVLQLNPRPQNQGPLHCRLAPASHPPSWPAQKSNPHSARRPAGAKLPATSCLGAFWTPPA